MTVDSPPRENWAKVFPISYRQFAEVTSIQETTGVPTAEEMIRQLTENRDAIKVYVEVAGNGRLPARRWR